MNAKFAGIGAEPKKLAILGVLVAAAAYFFISNRTPSDTPAAPARPTAALPGVTSPRAAVRPASRPGRSNRGTNVRNADGFKPSLKAKPGEEIDRSSIDPTLHLDLLAKLQKVTPDASGRSLFEIGAPPPPPPKEPEKIHVRKPFVGPLPAPPKASEAAAKAAEAQAPPIALKFYGFVNPSKSNDKRAFFLDGEDIIVATEGQTIKNRYKIVRIGVNSAVVEDTQFKNHQQTLPLVEEATG